MKKHIILLGILSLIGLTGMSSCGGTSLGTSDTIYTKTPVFDLSNPEEILSVQTEIEGSISSIKCGRVSIDTYSYSNGILNLKGDEVKAIPAGEKTLTVKTDKKTYSISIMVCTKVIKTAEDFQNINNNLTGIYVLGNDIDLSTISNFEPLGYFFSETDAHNSYFHGILDGNGYTIKNAKVSYSNDTTTNKSNYEGNYSFTNAAHQAGDNIGIFQIIGSSGIVRNTIFKDCTVNARTIGGIIAGNCSGVIENCVIDGGTVNISTHFWDDDCNVGGITGICAGSGSISNVISTAKATITGQYVDWSDEYVGKTATGGEHENDSDPYWTFWGADKVKAGSTLKTTDSNGHNTNGVYSGVGKCWGTVSNSYSLSYDVVPFNGSKRSVDFGQTHLAINKAESGDSDMGLISNCFTKTVEELKDSSLYSSFDTNVWNITNGRIPNIKAIYPTVSK